jgi:hypothetical protein
MHRHEAVAAAVLLSSCAVSAQGGPGVDRDRRTAEDPVIHWSAIAATIFPRQPGPILDGRAMAILHAAIHDAVNGVERRYLPYTAFPPPTGPITEPVYVPNGNPGDYDFTPRMLSPVHR